MQRYPLLNSAVFFCLWSFWYNGLFSSLTIAFSTLAVRFGFLAAVLRELLTNVLTSLTFIEPTNFYYYLTSNVPYIKYLKHTDTIKCCYPICLAKSVSKSIYYISSTLSDSYLLNSHDNLVRKILPVTPYTAVKYTVMPFWCCRICF